MRPICHVPLAGAVLLLLAALSSCAAPEENGTFVRNTGKSPGDSYSFTVDLGDSLCRHALYFYTVMDASAKDFDSMPRLLQLRIEAVSPSGDVFSEEAGIDKYSYTRRGSFSVQYESLYRSGFTPVEYGRWAFRVEVLNGDDFPGLRGLGLKHEKL